MDNLNCQCERCGCDIPEGTAYVSLTRNIEQTVYSVPDLQEEIQIFHSDELIRLCGGCGNQFNTALLVHLITALPLDASDN